MILVDADIFMYAGGTPHAHKEPSLDFLRLVALGEVEAAVDAEVLQEILHRYRAIKRWEDGVRVYELARRIVPTVLPVTAQTMDAARDLLDTHRQLMARDALHAAVFIQWGAEVLCSYDEDFDALEGVERREPGELL